MLKPIRILLVLFILTNSFFIFALVAGATDYTPNLKVTIGSAPINFQPFSCGDSATCPMTWLSQYISAVYQYGVALAAVLATVMMMVGGFLWLTSGGSPDRVGKAKEFIVSAFTGLLLALFSYMILYTVNPELVNLKPLQVQTAGKFVPPEIQYANQAAQAFDSLKNNYVSTLTAEQIAAGAGNINMQNAQFNNGETISGGDAYFTYDIPQTPELRQFLQQNAELRTSAPMPGIPDFINNTFFSTQTAFYYYQGAIYRPGTSATDGSPVIHVWANPIVSYFSRD